MLTMLLSAWMISAAPTAEVAPSLRSSLTLHASFDNGPNADHARGDATLYHSPTAERKTSMPGLPDSVRIVPSAGKTGAALHFVKKSDAAIFFQVDKNLPYRKTDWSGTVSFWLSLDPETDLQPGFADPIQITERAWNDAALWVDFSSDQPPRRFRLGAFADLKVWNPNNRDFDSLPPADKPMFDAGKPPFAKGRWSHVVIVFENFNTGQTNAVATLYLNGKPAGSVRGREQTFTWDPSKAAIMLGLSYTGLFDELMIFDGPLTAAEVAHLHTHGLDEPKSGR
jgi:hypothetical protein